MKVVFPAKNEQRTYDIHYAYMLNLLRAAGVEVSLENMPEPKGGCFPIKIDGKDFIVDYSDAGDVVAGTSLGCSPHFRFHYKGPHRIDPPCKDDPHVQINPFPPTSFHDWKQYDDLSKALNYTCGWDRILMKQRSYGDAVKRRDDVRAMLVNEFEEWVDTSHEDSQENFWRKGSECLVSVHVPGRNNNMLDRGQFQLMGLGVCTISPELPELLPCPWCETLFCKLKPGGNYIQCADDYSDLIEKVRWCRHNRDACRTIGQQAKKFFQETSTPQTVLKYMERVCSSLS